jgi:hypothetical protein
MAFLALLGVAPWQREKKKRRPSDDRVVAVKMMTRTPRPGQRAEIYIPSTGVSGASVQILWQERLNGAPAQTKSL